MSSYKVGVKEIYTTDIMVELTPEEEKLPLQKKLSLLKERAAEEVSSREKPIFSHALDSGEWTVEKVK